MAVTSGATNQTRRPTGPTGCPGTTTAPKTGQVLHRSRLLFRLTRPTPPRRVMFCQITTCPTVAVHLGASQVPNLQRRGGGEVRQDRHAGGVWRGCGDTSSWMRFWVNWTANRSVDHGALAEQPPAVHRHVASVGGGPYRGAKYGPQTRPLRIPQGCRATPSRSSMPQASKWRPKQGSRNHLIRRRRPWDATW